MTLPRMSAGRRSMSIRGVRYVGYPYIWAGEWGFDSPSPPAFGGRPGPGFDCSGLSWWALRADDDVYWEISPPRPYRGWPLPQRTSAEMARMTHVRLHYADLLPGDLMFYDGDDDGVVDHVDVYVGNGWSLDSSSSVGGVTLMWVKTGWYLHTSSTDVASCRRRGPSRSPHPRRALPAGSSAPPPSTAGSAPPPDRSRR